MAESPPRVQNRRRNMRRPSKKRVRVTCRRGGLDLGPNLGLAMVDLCEAGVRLVVKEPLEPGCAVSVGLEGQSHNRPTLRIGSVVWCLAAADGTYLTGVRFEKGLPYTFVLELTRESL